MYGYGTLPGGAAGSFIIMEALDLKGGIDQAALGRALAHMHLAAQNVRMHFYDCDHSCNANLEVK